MSFTKTITAAVAVLGMTAGAALADDACKGQVQHNPNADILMNVYPTGQGNRFWPKSLICC